MPWLLDTPVSSGDLDSDDYAEVKITQMRHRSSGDPSRDNIQLSLSYGNTVAGVWTSGVANPANKLTTARVEGAEYTTITQGSVPDVQTSDPADPSYAQVGAVWVERTYVASKRGLYEWLEAQGIIDAGSLT